MRATLSGTEQSRCSEVGETGSWWRRCDLLVSRSLADVMIVRPRTKATRFNGSRLDTAMIKGRGRMGSEERGGCVGKYREGQYLHVRYLGAGQTLGWFGVARWVGTAGS